MKTYEPCKKHSNGSSLFTENTPSCLECEIEVLRGEVRRLRVEVERLTKINSDLGEAVLDVFPPVDDKDEPADAWA
jgi:hypothetical protein